MSRVRAEDYGAKHQALLDSAASLFAEVGYPAAKLSDIARKCGATKSMLYHYFPTKDDLLLALLTEHLDRLIGDIDDVLAADGGAAQRFDTFIRVYVLKSVESRQRHLSAMNDVKFLPPAMQTVLRAKQARVAERVSALLKQLNPGLPADSYKPYAMFLLGMLNWMDLWFRTEGPISADAMCQRVSRLFTAGFLAKE